MSSNALPPAGLVRQLIALIDDDSYAITFQTMGQYRSALIAALRALPASAPVEPVGEADTIPEPPK